MRRSMIGWLIVAAMLAGAAPAAGANALRVAFGNEPQFPARTLIASAPANRSLTAATVHVTENGAAVKGSSVTPASLANAGDFGVILLIDTSPSMSGQPIRQAMSAARTLAAQRTGEQELGVITFNHATSTLLPLTNDPATITRALAGTPAIGAGTHIYDATLQAITELHDSNVAAGTVIILSDGADYGSLASKTEVASAAANDHIHVYSVGVRDRYFSSRTLTNLAQTTGGNYTSADANQLREVFLRIESALSNRYIIRYRSGARGGERIAVRLSINGVPGAWSGTYASPSPPAALAPSHTPERVAKPTFWASSLALVLVALASSVLLVGGLLFHFVPRTRQDDVRRRIGTFTQGPSTEPTPEPARRVSLSAYAGGRLAGLAWWPRFAEEVEVAAIERSPEELVVVTTLAVLAVAAVLSVLFQAVVIGVLIIVLAPAALWAIVRARADRQRREFSDQLPGHLEQIGSAMRAGHSVIASIAAMAKDAPEPTHREFERVVTDESLGVPLDAALMPVARRMACTDVDQLAVVATLNQQTGGNMAEVLDLIADGARERSELRRELRALTAQARMSRWIVTALPPALLMILLVVRPSYLRPLFHTTGGIIAIGLATALVLLGALVMRILVPAEV